MKAAAARVAELERRCCRQQEAIERVTFQRDDIERQRNDLATELAKWPEGRLFIENMVMLRMSEPVESRPDR